jgi:polyferredoxin
MNDRSIIWGKMKSLRTGSIYSFIVMAAIFVILSSIPFVTAVLSGGFYLTALGAVVTYLGVLFAQGRLRA